MNQLKEKRYRIAIIISVVIILCGLLMIPLSQTADNFPHDIWSNLILLMLMAGGGGIGAVISLTIIPRRHKRKAMHTIHTNRLKKKAWTDFCSLCVVTAMGLLGYGFLTYANIDAAMRIRMLITSLLYVGVTFGFIIFLNHKKSYTSLFDERELHLIQRAAHIGNSLFIAYVFLAPIIPFYLVGGRGMVPMWSIPLVLFSGVFFSGTIQFLVLTHYAKEDEKNIQGDEA